MEEKKPLKIKFKTAIVLIIIGAIILTIFGANVYASANGYGNVFFFIKYLITGEKPEISGKDELLSDRDITISYEPIVLTEKIKIQIRNLQIKDNKAKLFVAVNDNQSTEDTPLMYKVYNNENKLICDQKSSKEDNNTTEYIEELLLKEFKNDEKIIHLEIFNSKNQKLTRITINIETRELIVDGEKEAIEKISEIELKQFLGYVTSLEPNKDSEDERILFANSMLAQKEGLEVNKLDEVNKMLDATGYERLSNPLKNAEYFKIVNKGGINYIEVTAGRGGFEPDTVIEIKEISYCGGLYTAKFNYTFIHEPDTFNPNHLDELEIKETTVYFRKNEDTTYSTFKVVKFEDNNEMTKNVLIENDELIRSDIVTQLTPSGFAGSSLNRVELYSNKEVYLITFDGNGFENNNIKSNVLIAKNVDSIYKAEDGDIYIKSGIQIKDDIGWIHFEDGNNLGTNINSKTEYEKAEEAIKSKLLDKNWLKNNTLIKSANGNSNSIEEQDYKFAVIKEQDTKNPVVVLVVTAEKILTKNTFVISYKNNDVNIKKVSEGHYQHVDTLTNGEYYATTYEHMNEWAFELLEVSSDDIGVVDRNHGTLGDEDYDYMEVIDFENNNNLKSVITELNETNLNKLLKNQKNKNNIITSLTPSGFAGSSLNRVDLYSNKEVYLITFDGNGFEESNIISKELIARNADSIYKSDEGDITVKGGEKLVSTQNWIHFVQ